MKKSFPFYEIYAIFACDEIVLVIKLLKLQISCMVTSFYLILLHKHKPHVNTAESHSYLVVTTMYVIESGF